MLALTLACTALLATDTDAALAAKADPEEEPGRPYVGRDAQGNRIFGTDDKSEAGFRTDPETGDRTFRTAPPEKPQETWDGPQNIWVTPEIGTGYPGGSHPGHRPPGNRPPGQRPPPRPK